MGENQYLLAILLLLPLAGAVAVALVPRSAAGSAKHVALGFSLAAFAMSVWVAAGIDPHYLMQVLRYDVLGTPYVSEFPRAEFQRCFDWGGGVENFMGRLQLRASYDYLAALGIHIQLGVDAISLPLVLLTTFLTPLCMLGSFSSIREREKEFYFWLLLIESAMMGVFVAADLIFFYACFELTLVPLFFLIGTYGYEQRRWAAQKFFLFTLTGSMLTLAGVLYIAIFHAHLKGEWTFDIVALTYTARTQLPDRTQALLLLAMLAGFAVKVPLFPLHTWLPLAHTQAPTAGSVILAGVMLKLGTYGLFRFVIPMLPVAVFNYGYLVAIACIIGIFYAALICWVQSDLKKLIAYSSISHLGFCVLGLFAFNTIGMAGGVMYMVNHGLSTGALFLCVGFLYERFHTREMGNLTGMAKRMPVWSVFFVFFCLASVGLPGLNGFVGEFLTLQGAMNSGVLGFSYATVAAAGMILAAVYIFYMIGRVVFGPVADADSTPAPHHGGSACKTVADLNAREITVLTPIALMCLALGLFPAPLLRSMESAIRSNTRGIHLFLQERNLAGATPAGGGPVLAMGEGDGVHNSQVVGAAEAVR